MTFRVDRNLQILMPLLAATTCAILVRAWQLGLFARAGIVALVLLQAIWGADTIFYGGHDRLRSAVALISAGFEGRRDDRFEYRHDFRAVNDVVPTDALVVLHNSHESLGIERDILLDWPGFEAGVIYDGLGGPRALYDYWRGLGVTHVLQAPERRPSAKKRDDVLWAEYIKRYAIPVRAGSLEVTTLGAPPPPDAPGYTVLCVGLHGYADGIYPLDALSVHEGLPESFRRYPAPKQPFPEQSQIDAGLDDVDAILTSGESEHLRAIAGAVSRDFMPASNFSGGYVVSIRKSPRQ
jgi:hypothetical protein